MKALDKEYTIDFSHYDKESWYEIMSHFQDANIYQAWSYDMVRFGRKRVAHMVLRKGNAVVAAAQARIYQLPMIKAGIAYVLWGPMWRPKGVPEDREVFRQTIRALEKEFSLRRGFVLRIFPLSYRVNDEWMEQTLFDEGYQIYNDGKTHRTLVVDLDPSLAELRAGLDQKWRNCLNRAEKNGLELIFGEEECLFDEFKEIYDEMTRRKELAELGELNHLKLVQRDLPPNLKLKVILCRLSGVLSAGAIFSAIGHWGVYLSGATSKAGMKTNGSYMIQWAFVKWLKENGFRFYDLNGINPITNPGTYHFKRGLAGKHGTDVEFLGKYQATDSLMSSSVVKSGEWLMSRYNKIVSDVRSQRCTSHKEIPEK
jgi:lipid II:glycine glycyltransferase (peptidoglycan interpeptide bridge formation enzyme)